MNDEEKIKQIIEGLLLAAGKPMSLDKIAEVFTQQERPEREVLKRVLQEIEKGCEGAIEKIRGVAVSSSIIRTLLDRDWVRVVGHRDVPGRPAMYASTREFLDYFNLQNLDELPALTEIRDIEDPNQNLTLDEEKPVGIVLEYPEGLEDDEVIVPDEEELAAAAIGTRSIDEILGIQAGPDEDLDEDDEYEVEEVESESESETDDTDAKLELDDDIDEADHEDDEELTG